MKRDCKLSELKCLTILIFFLTLGCQRAQWSHEEFEAVKETFNRFAHEIPPENNAAIRYKNLFLQITNFPDAMKTVDEICEGKPLKSDSHLKNWIQRHQGVLKQLERVVSMESYRLRHKDFVWDEEPLWEGRLSKMLDLSTLVLMDAALKLRETPIKRLSQKKISEITKRVFMARKMCNHLTCDGTLQDFHVANVISRRCALLLSQILPSLNEESLKKIIIDIEGNTRSLGSLERFHENQKRLAPVYIMHWLKPHKDDNFSEKMAQPSSEELQGQLAKIFDKQTELIDLPLHVVFENAKWKKFTKLMETQNDFIQSFFHFVANEGRHMSSFTQASIHLTYITLGDEMMQLKAAAHLYRHQNNGAWPQSFKQLEKFVRQHHLENATLSGPERPLSFLDSFSGQSYGYRVEDDILTLWSQGPDFKNDAGLEAWDGQRGDLVLTIKP